MAVVPLQEQLTEGRRGLMWDLLHNRSFTVGATIFLAMLLVSLIAGLFIPPAAKDGRQLPATTAAAAGYAARHHCFGPERCHPVDGGDSQLDPDRPDCSYGGHRAWCADRFHGRLLWRLGRQRAAHADRRVSLRTVAALSHPDLGPGAQCQRGHLGPDHRRLRLAVARAPGARPGPQPQGTRLRAAGAALGDGRHGNRRARVDSPHGTVVGRQLRQRLYCRRAGRVGSVNHRAWSRSAR